MSSRNGRDYLYVVWKDMVTRARTVIGELSKNGKYEFKYDLKGVEQAKKMGFSLLVAFPDIDKVYESQELFPVFSSRLPDKRRPDIRKVLQRYNLDCYDQFELLRNSMGRLPIDGLEFADPIFLDDLNATRQFYLAGSRHYNICDSNLCELIIDLEVGQKLILHKEPENSYDPYAVGVFNSNNNLLGYIPVFYSQAVTTAINQGKSTTCEVKAIRSEFKKCQECINVELVIK